MKNIKTILNLIIAATLLSTPGVYAAGEHDHAHGKEKAPHQGRLMESDKGHIEFVVAADKTAKVYLYGHHLKAIAPSDEKVTLIVQGKDNSKEKIEFTKKEDAFVSSAPLKLSEGAKAVLTVKTGEKTKNLRFDLDMSVCGGCKTAEYACSCGH